MSHTVQDMEKYYNELLAAYEAGVYDTTSNKDSAHNATMLRFMFDKSTEINMYCGEMSILRSGFYKEISKDNRTIEENKEGDVGEYLKRELIKSIKDFIDRGDTHLNIILESFSPSYLNDLIDSDLFQLGLDRQVITVRQLDLNQIQTRYLSHFSFSDKKILRMESDKAKHEGICAFNIDKKMFDVLTKNFTVLKVASVSIKKN